MQRPGQDDFGARTGAQDWRHLVEFDSLRHGPNWTITPDDELRAAIAPVVATERWTIDALAERALGPLVADRVQLIVGSASRRGSGCRGSFAARVDACSGARSCGTAIGSPYAATRRSRRCLPARYPKLLFPAARARRQPARSRPRRQATAALMSSRRGRRVHRGVPFAVTTAGNRPRRHIATIAFVWADAIDNATPHQLLKVTTAGKSPEPQRVVAIAFH